MKFTILALAAVAAAANPKWRGQVTYCNNGPAGTRPGCSSIMFTTEGCHNFDIVNGVRRTAQLIFKSDNLHCDAFSEGDCAGTDFGTINNVGGMKLDGTAGTSSVNCVYSGK